MLNKLISSLKQLEENAKSPSYFEDFSYLIAQIGNLKNPDSIPALVQFLNDESEEWDLMYGIIHTIEVFDDDVYIKNILKVSPFLYRNSPEFASIIFVRIINSENCKIELIHQLRKSSLVVRSSVKNIIEEINKENPEFLSKTVPVLIATSI